MDELDLFRDFRQAAAPPSREAERQSVATACQENSAQRYAIGCIPVWPARRVPSKGSASGMLSSVGMCRPLRLVLRSAVGRRCWRAIFAMSRGSRSRRSLGGLGAPGQR